ncbi:hypothetical protein ncot_11820 [Nocardioides sp. JQ2195]|uniref:tubulin-like doman-containing protein n=1 Tax=Nocardioides sp. JQ2195 TaxID=2592334 RepID=UPI00143EB30C|nr:tubulin-like doman-containing protein [Nocardioides sp. JQ2195]QIX27210.1 hypothetical protein ncot_11820 [Nocardioides sp. JQ2195]
MKKFLVVGVGGSGGATLRYLMDQLRADLRVQGINELPPAWQFVQVDVNPQPERTEGLGSIEDLGGRYVSVSSAGNTFRMVRQTVETRLGTAGHLDGLLGWSPTPRDQANEVPVGTGAGQFRAVGRMLTLTRLDLIQKELQRAWQELQQASPWGELPVRMKEQGPYDSNGVVVPIVVGSLAGGSGASMFLDVCRVMGRVGGLRRTQLGTFLYTPDVFSSLDPAQRKGIDGNALGALGELLSAQTGSSNDIDNDLLEAFGLAREKENEAAFGSVFPIGSTIGGDGARFGDSAEDIYRGLGRALAATISSETAAHQYLRSRFENPTAPTGAQELIGWGANPSAVGWGSFGYASLSLGRDRYAEYAAQRLARVAVDRLVVGFRRNAGDLSPTEQLDRDVRNQWPTILERLGLRQPEQKASAWLSSGPLPERQERDIARAAAAPLKQAAQRIIANTGANWMPQLQQALPSHQSGAVQSLREAAYAWAEQFADKLEADVGQELLRILAHPHQGLPYARKVIDVLTSDLTQLAEELAKAPAAEDLPLRVKDDLDAKLRKVEVSQEVKDKVVDSVIDGLRRDLKARAAHHARGVLKSFVDDVLPAMARALKDTQKNLETAMRSSEGQAGLAQLHSTIYNEWPDGDLVPPRFEHAHNEVLLTTSGDFPVTFKGHVEANSSDGVFTSALDEMVEQIIVGKWEDTGASVTDFQVMETRQHWRSPELPTGAASKEPTPPTKPIYHFALRTGEILERALAFQARQGHFSDYSNETFDGYLNEPRVSEAEREERRTRLVKKFEETVKQAHPLVGVNRQMIEAVNGDKFQVELTFGVVPLPPGSRAANEVLAYLERSPDLESQSADRFKEALSEASTVSKIAVYGAYPKYSPLVFSSFLAQLQDRWSNLTEAGRREIWKWKRTRPLPASIGMGPKEQKAMVSGWYIGRALGLISQPADGTSNDPVQVFDLVDGVWRPFAMRQLTPRDQYRGAVGFEWLPGILEGHSLAVVNTVNDTMFASLLPYRALRRIHDDGMEPAGAATSVSAGRLIENWLRDGSWPSGEPSPISTIRDAAEGPDERAAALKSWVELVQAYVTDNFLTKPRGPGALAERRLAIASSDKLDHAPMLAEIALLTHHALKELLETIERAREASTRGEGHGAIPEV